MFAQSSDEAGMLILTITSHTSNTDIVTEITAVLHKFVDSEGNFIKIINTLLDTGSSKPMMSSHCIPKQFFEKKHKLLARLWRTNGGTFNTHYEMEVPFR